MVNAFLQEDVSLPDAPNIRIMPNEAKALIASKVRLENFWKHSSYYLEEAALKTSKIIPFFFLFLAFLSPLLFQDQTGKLFCNVENIFDVRILKCA